MGTATTEVLPLATAARRAMGMSIQDMAALTGVPYATLRSWGYRNPDMRKEPSGAARTLLALCVAKPELMREVLREQAQTTA